MGKAADLIRDRRAFRTGTLYRDSHGAPCGQNDRPRVFDCLGALLVAYPIPEKRADIAKAVFDLCATRHGHRRIGSLEHEDAVALLTDAGA